jgi:hypothetical protein
MTTYYPLVSIFAVFVLIAVLALWGPQRFQHGFEFWHSAYCVAWEVSGYYSFWTD